MCTTLFIGCDKFYMQILSLMILCIRSFSGVS